MVVDRPKAVYYVAQKLKTRFFIINRAGDEFLCLVSRPENLPNFSGQTLISGNLAKIRFCFSGHIINSLTGLFVVGSFPPAVLISA